MKDLNQLPCIFWEAIKHDKVFQVALIVAALFLVTAIRQIGQASAPVSVSISSTPPGPTSSPAPGAPAPTGSLFSSQPQAVQGAAPAGPTIKEVKPGQSLDVLDSKANKPDDNFARVKKGNEPKKVEVVQ